MEKVFFGKNRDIKNLNDTFVFFSEEHKNLVSILDSILNISSDSLINVFKKIYKNKEEFDFIVSFIIYCIYIRCKNSQLYVKLLCLLTRIGSISVQNRYPLFVSTLLSYYGIIEQKISVTSTRYKDVVHLFPDGTIERIIKDDDCDAFVEFVSNPDFDANGKVLINDNIPAYFVETPMLTKKSLFEGLHMNRWVTYMQLIAFFGSVKCFKAAISINAFPLDDISKYAVAGGNTEIISILLQHGCSFDNCFETSVSFHRYEISNWLLENYSCEMFDLSLTEYYFNDRAFFFALKNDFRVSQESINKTLIATSITKNFWMTKYLIEEFNADYIQGFDDEYPFYISIANSDIKLTKYFIEERHYDIDKYKSPSKVPLHFAVKNNSFLHVRYFLEELNADVNEKNNDNETVFFVAVRNRNLFIAKYLFENWSVDANVKINNKTPLHVALINPLFDMIDFLITDCKIDIEERDENGLTPFQLACYNKNYILGIYLVKHCNANVNVKDIDGKTPLHVAIEDGNSIVYKYLIEDCKADVETKDKEGRTALHFASENNDLEAVKYLVEECHANVNAVDNRGYIPLQMSRSKVYNYLKCIT